MVQGLVFRIAAWWFGENRGASHRHGNCRTLKQQFQIPRELHDRARTARTHEVPYASRYLRSRSRNTYNLHSSQTIPQPPPRNIAPPTVLSQWSEHFAPEIQPILGCEELLGICIRICLHEATVSDEFAACAKLCWLGKSNFGAKSKQWSSHLMGWSGIYVRICGMRTLCLMVLLHVPNYVGSENPIPVLRQHFGICT